tara:strand:+ start:18371 stop:19630 length:1260 start_codon:yes stop_codon:yes gene_type:complete
MTKINSFREAISDNLDEKVIFGYELLSQPDDTLDTRIPGIRKRNEAIITVARDRDIVLLSNPVSQDYHQWLRRNEFSTDNIYVCDADSTIPKSVVRDGKLPPWLAEFDGDKIYAARYSGDNEVQAAKLLGAKLYGCSEDITLKFYDKVSFKKLCEERDLPILQGTTVNIAVDGADKLHEVINGYLVKEDQVIAKDPKSSAGANIYIINRLNYQDMLDKIRLGGHQELLIEKMIEPVSEINDQWTIGLDGDISHIASSDQLVVNYAHTGNVYPSQSKQVKKAQHYSLEIGRMMRDAGYVGLFGIDYLEDNKGSLYISENNSRMNGSTPAWDLVNRLESRHGPVQAVRLYQIRHGTAMCFEELANKTRDLIYGGKSQYGFFPLDQGLLEQCGAFTILATGSSEQHAQAIVKETLARIKYGE